MAEGSQPEARLDGRGARGTSERRGSRGAWLAAAAVVSALLTVAVWLARRQEERFQFTDTATIETVAAERGERPSAADPGDRGGPETWRYYLSEEHVRSVFNVPDHRPYDPWVYFRDVPHRSDVRPWPEHPDGSITIRTNSLGLRDDELGAPADLEMFVVGDSNTAGICNEDESYSNRLEALLAAEHPQQSVSVVNLGVGGYGFYNYLGAVEEYARRAPAAFVVTIFGGNDFSGILPLNRIFEHGPTHAWTGDLGKRRKQALERDDLLMTHCYNSALLFHAYPQRVELVVRLAVGLVGEMREVCDAHGVQLVILYLPEPCAFDWDPPVEGAAEIREILQLDPDDCRSSSRIADAFLRAVAGRGVPVVDMRPVFEALPAPPYWRRDLHMNLDAHELTARALFEVLR